MSWLTPSTEITAFGIPFPQNPHQAFDALMDLLGEHEGKQRGLRDHPEQ